MKFIIVILALFLGTIVALVGLALAQGFFLHWAIPSLDLSIAVLIALVATIVAFRIVTQLVKIVFDFNTWLGFGEDEDEEDDEEEDDRDEAHSLRAPAHSGRRPRRRRKRR